MESIWSAEEVLVDTQAIEHGILNHNESLVCSAEQALVDTQAIEHGILNHNESLV
ncbi:hypothetical protein [Streptomyces sp. 1222.5]|uniref:hypothetical protein n=1 Tax=Streptomyces sp. 1222.5 TaxID=1881026 RepID=UPI003EB6DCC3